MGMNADTATQLLTRLGAQPVLLGHRSKQPVMPKWQHKEYTRDEILSTFDERHNLGLRCGYNNLVDVDPDAPEAVALAPHFLPPTGMRHGRTSTPDNHRWYICDPAPEKRKTWLDPLRGPEDACLIEIRSHGGQTMIPPSIHPEGEQLQWSAPLEELAPAHVPAEVIVDAAAKTAACALICRYWPGKGARHDFALALGGTLIRHGWEKDAAVQFVQLAGSLAGDEETFQDRTRAVEDTRATLAKGGKATGIPTLKRYLDERVLERVLEWLGIEGRDDPAASRVEFSIGVRDATVVVPWREILDEIEPLDPDVLPYYLERMVSYLRPKMVMFPSDWWLGAALPLWSSLWPGVRLQNLNVAVWVFGVARQSSGKNYGPDALARIIRAVGSQHTWQVDGEEQRLKHFTNGSPQGLWDMLAGRRVACLWYQREFAGMLKMIRKSDYMSGMRESLCNIYDGVNEDYARAQNKGVHIEEPHLAALVTTNKDAVVREVDAEDLLSGFMSRFLIVSSDYVQTAPATYATDPAVDLDLIRGLRDHLGRHRDITRIEWETGAKDPPIIDAFRDHLGLNTGEIVDLDDDDDLAVVPPGRLLAQTKKVAALLELAERSPNRRGEHTVVIRETNIELAIQLVQRYHAYALRMRTWVAQGTDLRNAEKVLKALVRNKDGLTAREVQQRTHLRSVEVRDALRLLVDDGKVVFTERAGRTVFRTGVKA